MVLLQNRGDDLTYRQFYICPAFQDTIRTMQPDQIIRTRRKTYALILKPDGTLVVRAPLHATDRQIAKILSEKKSWIEQKRAELRQRQAQPKLYQPGERFLFLGQFYPLEIVEHQREALTLNGSFRLRRDRLENAPAVFEAWYRAQARQMIPLHAALFAGLHSFEYKTIRITGARTRWGSCGSKGTLNFSWRLMMAPPSIIEYVVVHELCHLRQHNHSKAFWELVESILPDYRRRQKWLKTNARFLTL